MPAYYSFSQELTVKHQGMLTGVLSCLCWLGLAGWQEFIGHVVQYTQSYTVCMVLAGAFPLIGFAALMALWGKEERRRTTEPLEKTPTLDLSGLRPADENQTITR
jgi:hypothetical protein